ncbi:MAG: 5'/3'-nucleotidase SurE [Clostridia bacterium]
MHIFLVNDDGIGSAGIMALLHAAVARGHRVTMCAPKQQQSAASHRITLADPIFAAEWHSGVPSVRAFAIAGSPVDCVRVGLFNLTDAPVDVLISGINDGYNAGMAVYYSGTVGAAREGALNGVPSIAASIHFNATQTMLDALAARVIAVAEQYAQKPTPPCTLLNINAPSLEPASLKPECYAPLSMSNFVDRYERRESPRSGTYFWLMEGCAREQPEPGSDQFLLDEGHIVYTLLGNPRSASSSSWEALGIQ